MLACSLDMLVQQIGPAGTVLPGEQENNRSLEGIVARQIL